MYLWIIALLMVLGSVDVVAALPAPLTVTKVGGYL